MELTLIITGIATGISTVASGVSIYYAHYAQMQADIARKSLIAPV